MNATVHIFYGDRHEKLSQWLLRKRGLFLKVERMTSLAEAHTIIFVAQHTNIPVPKIHCAFVHKGRKYIVMSRVRGDQPARGWHKRSEESKQKIFQQLRSTLQELRAVPQPNGGMVGLYAFNMMKVTRLF
ncbi:hypothetical protein PpBr36_07517 [Pyricularia pennisetigena]|uniref:hypothetical protein n=1 Tax=Pyricularia pennisetigena TaxID=1578925 RepID=UPI001154B15B|nr:hypothetical protein PpBr36_07517 [Pyricularia pennisetigena]TLS25087.1 hypothetical protein PpBr36_07517 [Pyricularia pennisetigena]